MSTNVSNRYQKPDQKGSPVRKVHQLFCDHKQTQNNFAFVVEATGTASKGKLTENFEITFKKGKLFTFVKFL
jgi:hypothetical protein